MQMKTLTVVESIQAELDAVYVNDSVKPVCAPFYTLGSELVSKLPVSEGSVLVLSDLGLLMAALRKFRPEQVTFVAHTAEQEAFSQKLAVKNWQVGYNDPIAQLEKHLMGLKFDIVVANPPYGNLHLPILKKCVEHLTPDGTYISVQPVRWLQDPLWKEKKINDAKRMQSVLEGKLDSIEIIVARDASKLFSATFGFDLGIFVVKNGGGALPYDTFSQIPKGINISPFKHFLVDTGFRFDSYDGKMQHFVPVITIAAATSGGFDGSKQGTVMHQENYGYFTDGVSHKCKYGNGLSLEQAHKANKRRTMGKTIGAVVKSFSTPEEAKNFYNFIKLDAFRFFIYITTLDVNIQCKFLPFPNGADAFTTPWDNQRFYEHFNVAETERQLIEETMKQFPVE
jgi:SAM-dependent methyltransferase